MNIEAMIDKMLENTPVFVSSVDEHSGKAEVTVYNNSQETLDAVGIVAEYNNKRLLNLDEKSILLQGKQTIKLSYNKANKVKFMVWDSITGLKPLYYVSKYIDLNGNNTK